MAFKTFHKLSCLQLLPPSPTHSTNSGLQLVVLVCFPPVSLETWLTHEQMGSLQQGSSVWQKDHSQGVWVRSLVRELRSHMPHGAAKKKKEKAPRWFGYAPLFHPWRTTAAAWDSFPHPLRPPQPFFCPFFFFFFNWSIVDLKCCVSFCWTAKWISYTYTYIHSF